MLKASKSVTWKLFEMHVKTNIVGGSQRVYVTSNTLVQLHLSVHGIFAMIVAPILSLQVHDQLLYNDLHHFISVATLVMATGHAILINLHLNRLKYISKCLNNANH
jgi:uncharacterized membrane protein